MSHIEGSLPHTRPPPALSLVPRLMIVLMTATLIFLGASVAVETVFDGRSLTQHAVSAVAICVLVVPVVLVARRFLDRRPLSTLGFGVPSRAWRDLLYGVLIWLIPALAGLAAVSAFGWLEFQFNSPVSEMITAVLLLTVLVFLLEAFPEELVFRGYVHRNLIAVLPPWSAVMVQALIFTAFGLLLWVISAGWGVLVERAVLFFTMGVVLGIIRHISGSLWATIGFHLAFQVTMQLILGGNYADIGVSSETVFTVATAVVTFTLASTLAGLFWRGEQDWKQPLPDQPAETTRRR